MNSTDLAQLLGYLVSAWCIGFAMGYTVTKYRDAMTQVG